MLGASSSYQAEEAERGPRKLEDAAEEMSMRALLMPTPEIVALAWTF